MRTSRRQNHSDRSRDRDRALAQASVDRVSALGSLPPTRLHARALEATQRGVRNLAHRQNALGSWSGDYGGPMFLLPMYVIGCRVAEVRIPEARRRRMVTYLYSAQHADGSVGLHVEGEEGCLFTTVLSYVALRLLGEPAEAAGADQMRTWIRANGTALQAAPWAKWMLALLNLYEYEGLNPITPETWLLPYAFPVHPGRLWCHCRQVYLPMSFLYGIRAQIPPDDEIRALRKELYDQPYDTLPWARYRNTVRLQDTYTPLTTAMRAANRVLLAFEWASARLPKNPLRRRALKEVLRHVHYEDQVTQHIDIGPVNSVLNVICHHFAEPGGDAFHHGLAALEEYLWEGHDGLKLQGYNSSQLWDTVFAVQALLATPFTEEDGPTLTRAYDYIRDNQILDDVPHHRDHYRDRSRGGWPFSNRAHGWPITDCTAEGFKAAVLLEGRVTTRAIPEDLLRDAVSLILGWQNDDGGWATYERRRAGPWLELLNPSFVFGDIMVDHSYPECTSACLQALALALARRHLSGAPYDAQVTDAQIAAALARGERYLRTTQRPDGSWQGSWGICFTYGTWFGVWGLLAAGATPDDPALGRACDFLLGHQRADGGWGEHHRACAEGRWVDHADGQVVMTSWALLALIRVQHPDHEAIARGIAFLTQRQAKDGSWPREAIAGMFNKTCAITYDNYRHTFPVWALGLWLQCHLP